MVEVTAGRVLDIALPLAHTRRVRALVTILNEHRAAGLVDELGPAREVVKLGARVEFHSIPALVPAVWQQRWGEPTGAGGYLGYFEVPRVGYRMEGWDGVKWAPGRPPF